MKLTLTLTKCLDPEAFCELRIDQVNGNRNSSRIKTVGNGNYVQRTTFGHRNVEVNEEEGSRSRSIRTKNKETKTEYDFPLGKTNFKGQEWEKQVRSRITQQNRSNISPRLIRSPEEDW
jgi:hypothetical protein